MAAIGEEFRELLLKEAIKQQTFIVRDNDTRLVAEETNFILEFCPIEPLICNVLEVSKLFTSKKPFRWQIIPGWYEDNISKNGQMLRIPFPIGRVRFIYGSGVPEELNYLPSENTQAFKECHYDPFSKSFFETLKIYAASKNINYFDIPLRICEWCEQPFFGKRHDQRFCCRDHSQRWHARNSYLKKKAAK